MKKRGGRKRASGRKIALSTIALDHYREPSLASKATNLKKGGRGDLKLKLRFSWATRPPLLNNSFQRKQLVQAAHAFSFQ